MYQPNLNDPRNQRRLQMALDYVTTYVNPFKPVWLATRHIDKHFGQQQHALSKWLRKELLICVDESFNKDLGYCKKYIQNIDGINRHLKSIGYTPKPAIAPEVEQQLASGDFEYEEKSNRLWNPLQQLPKRVKRPLLAQNGMNYSYDIQCCAPTLLLQYAQKCGLATPTPNMDAYLKDRSTIRKNIADDTGITVDDAKFVINALLQGGQISYHRESSISIRLNGNQHLIGKLKDNQYLLELREEIKSIWTCIKPTLPVRYLTDKNGKTRRCALNGRDKSGVYRSQEELVLKEIKRYLKKNKNKALLEHDGWTCEKIIDEVELRSYVKATTGYQIELECEIYE
jgi:hypothetical protein